MSIPDDDRRILQETHDATTKITEWLVGPNGVIATQAAIIVRLNALEAEALEAKNFRWKVMAICGICSTLSGALGLKAVSLISSLFAGGAGEAASHVTELVK